MVVGSVSAMQIEEDPRIIPSFLDKSLTPELDILRVTTNISPENHLIFQVKTRGEPIDNGNNNYLLLQILNEKTYLFLLPLNKEKGDKVLIYEGSLLPENHELLKTPMEFKEYPMLGDFNAKHIFQGAEFIVPLDWINYGADFSFDAYTVQASLKENILEISEVYDQARRRHTKEKRFSAMTLLNKLCSPKR
jgi:hypothetical protein